MNTKIQTGLRLPEQQYLRLQTMASEMGVSLNALILLLIDVGLKVLEKPEGSPHDPAHNHPNISEQ